MLCSNCTFMELKFFTAESISSILSCSNCTFMELKCGSLEVSQPRSRFKLYLYGIEISYRNTRTELLYAFKLYLYGIEIRYLRSFGCSAQVQIVPLWN